ncbi:hypothetical protein [Nonomuraea wenchangensis]|uniref:hypothetical protein n=1 Tax=Nonomuraea wenchangensis TaxID=568860 RepID=UPI00343711EB
MQRNLLREDGTNKLLGPAESCPADEGALRRVQAYEPDSPRSADVRELSPAQQALADAIAVVLEIAVREVVLPYAREVAAPALKRKLSAITKSLRSKTREVGTPAGTAVLTLTSTPPTDPSREVDAAVEEPITSMSSAEYRQRLIATLAAEAYATDQKRVLANTRIEDGELPPELRRAIMLALDGNSSSLDEETLAVVTKFLRGAVTADGQYALTRNEEIKKLRDRRTTRCNLGGPSQLPV